MSVMCVIFTRQVEHADLPFTPSVNFQENSGVTSGCSDWSLTRQKIKIKSPNSLSSIQRHSPATPSPEQSGKTKALVLPEKELTNANGP